MALTIAITKVDPVIELIQFTQDIYYDGVTFLDIRRLGWYVELHQLIFSANLISSAVKFGQLDSINYLILTGDGVTAINCDFSSAPLVFSLHNRYLTIDPGGILTAVTITLWYRFIQTP